MGYYSEVAIAIKEKEYKNMLKKLEDDKRYEDKKYIKDFIETASNDVPCCFCDEEYIFLHWDSYKWYDEFEEVKFVMEYIKSIKNYDFIRIGEDNEDMEVVMQTGKFLLNPIKTIEFR